MISEIQVTKRNPLTKLKATKEITFIRSFEEKKDHTDLLEPIFETAFSNSGATIISVICSAMGKMTFGIVILLLGNIRHLVAELGKISNIVFLAINATNYFLFV